jgi:hypothetical protein
MVQAVFQTWMCIFLCLSFCIGSHPPLVTAAGQTYELQLVHRRQDRVLASFPVHPGQKFSLHYIHSSDHTPVVAVFQVTAESRIVLVPGGSAAGNRGADFVKRLAPALRAGTSHLTRLRAPAVIRPTACSHPSCSRVSAAIEEKYAWYGAGLAFHSHNKIDTSQGWTRVQLQRAMDPFHLRVGRVANHTLCIAQTTLSLKDIAAGGTSLWIRVRPKGEMSHD